MSSFFGNLVQGRELAKTARQRKQPYHEITIPKADQADYLAKGWTIAKLLKTRVRLHKDKVPGELFEDEIWQLFWKTGFTVINKDRNFKIQAGPVQKQIDIFAKDENDIFVVECKYRSEQTNVIRQDIHELANLKKDIIDSIKNEYGKKNMRISFVMATHNIKWNEKDEGLARNNGIFVFKDDNIKVFNGLIQHLGVSARFPIYSILFKGKKIPVSKRIKVPALFGGKGNEKYYSFLIEPEKLLQISYVHRRESGLEEIVDSYQRMAEKKRLKKISAFITGGGYFVNNIILSFREKPTFHMDKKEKQVGGAVPGMLEFPPYYASAWIIDGQHRLYGYADNKRKKTEVIPVIAFESLSTPEQAKLFVQINKEQKAVKANLLWDLYPDIYGESEDNDHQHLRAVSLLAKRLNSNSDSKLYCHIGIHSHSTLYKGRNITNLTLNTVCEAIKESGLINKEDPILYKDNYESTVNSVSEILKSYFAVIAESFPEDWEFGEKGLLRSNNGIRILIIIFRQIIMYLKHAERDGIYKKKDLSEFRYEVKKLLNPMIVQLKALSAKERSDIRSQSTKAKVVDNARQMAWWIREEFEGFGKSLIGNWSPSVPKEESDEEISSLVKDTEIKLRTSIGEALLQIHDTRWWKDGIPGEVQQHIKETMHKKVASSPYMKDKLSEFTPATRLSYTTIGDLKQIITHSPNWQAFEPYFGNKEKAITNLDYFYGLRNIYSHPPTEEEETDEIAKQQGYWAVKWIRKCIGLEK